MLFQSFFGKLVVVLELRSPLPKPTTVDVAYFIFIRYTFNGIAI